MAETVPPLPSPEKTIADNARKFIAKDVDRALFSGENSVSYILTTDWLETGEDSETKIVHKEFPDGTVQTLLITKVRVGDERVAKKRVIPPNEYATLLQSSRIRVEKRRSELTIEQNGVTFALKYDEFAAPSDLRILEVDAVDTATRDMFDPAIIPGDLTEVSTDRTYEGYQIADHL